MDCKVLVLVGDSYLRRVAGFFSWEDWKVIDLTTPGWRISYETVQNKLSELKKVAKDNDLEKAFAILHPFDNSVHMVGGPLESSIG